MQQKILATGNHPKIQKHPNLKFGLSWLILIPGSIWAILVIYLPLFGGTLKRIETWMTTPVIILFVAVSLGCHILAHLWAARLTGAEYPSELTILIFGDAAQGWSGISSGWREIIATAAGPFANLLIAGLAYWLWHAQLNDFWGNIVLAVSGFNLWLFVINLIPAFPMDGGRLLRSLLGDMPVTLEFATRLLRYLGFVASAALIGWGFFLLLQHSRFSIQNAMIEVLCVFLLLDGLRSHPVAEKKEWAPLNQNARFQFLRAAGVGLLVLILSRGGCHASIDQQWSRCTRCCPARGINGERPGPISTQSPRTFLSYNRHFTGAHHCW